MANIIYYLGAGASANALPTVAEMTDRLGLFGFALDKRCMDLSNSQEKLDAYRKHYRIYELKDFIEDLKKRRSIDTYAKELYIRNEHEEIKGLKKILYFYLNWEELFTDNDLDIVFAPTPPNHPFDDYRPISKIYHEFINYTLDLGLKIEKSIFYDYYKKFAASLRADKGRLKLDSPDQRYVNFLTDILMPGEISLQAESSSQDKNHPQPKFPKDNIKIISWNYDNQIELACNKLQLGEDFFKNVIKPNLKKLNGNYDFKDLIPKSDYQKRMEKKSNYKEIINKKTYYDECMEKKNDYEESIKKLLDASCSTIGDWSQKIRFAWEGNISNDNTSSASNDNISYNANDNIVNIINNVFNNSNDNKSTDEIVHGFVKASAEYNEEHSKEDNKKHIVVIGYSFPFANRAIDENILLELIRHDNYYITQKVACPIDIHIQVPDEEEYDNIKERMMILISKVIPSEEERNKITFYHRRDRKNFFIPNAL